MYLVFSFLWLFIDSFIHLLFSSHFRCRFGFLKLWDGLRQPGRYPFPANTLCGDYNNGEINVTKFTSQITAEIEFYIEKYIRHATFTITYKYINLGKYYQHLLYMYRYLKIHQISICIKFMFILFTTAFGKIMEHCL